MSAGPFAPGRAVVVGAGPAGLVASLALARRGWNVRLVSRPERRPRPARIDVLSASAIPTLLGLGISHDEIHDIASPCPGTWCRWEAEASGHDYLNGPFGAALAVDRTSLDRLLCEYVSKAGIPMDVDDCSGRPVDDGRTWTILASGNGNAFMEYRSDAGRDDRLIGLVAIGQTKEDVAQFDRRLFIEAAAEGWAYGVLGPGGIACIGVITDAQTMAGNPVQTVAAGVLEGTDRVVGLARKMRWPLVFRAIPIPCRWRHPVVGPRALRIGDAQASFDPISGRGLWSAIRTAEDVALALCLGPESLPLLAQKSRASYDRYLAHRLHLHRAARSRFDTPFWKRRFAALREREAAQMPSAG